MVYVTWLLNFSLKPNEILQFVVSKHKWLTVVSLLADNGPLLKTFPAYYEKKAIKAQMKTTQLNAASLCACGTIAAVREVKITVVSHSTANKLTVKP